MARLTRTSRVRAGSEGARFESADLAAAFDSLSVSRESPDERAAELASLVHDVQHLFLYQGEPVDAYRQRVEDRAGPIRGRRSRSARNVRFEGIEVNEISRPPPYEGRALRGRRRRTSWSERGPERRPGALDMRAQDRERRAEIREEMAKEFHTQAVGMLSEVAEVIEGLREALHQAARKITLANARRNL